MDGKPGGVLRRLLNSPEMEAYEGHRYSWTENPRERTYLSESPPERFKTKRARAHALMMCRRTWTASDREFEEYTDGSVCVVSYRGDHEFRLTKAIHAFVDDERWAEAERLIEASPREQMEAFRRYGWDVSTLPGKPAYCLDEYAWLLAMIVTGLVDDPEGGDFIPGAARLADDAADFHRRKLAERPKRPILTAPPKPAPVEPGLREVKGRGKTRLVEVVVKGRDVGKKVLKQRPTAENARG